MSMKTIAVVTDRPKSVFNSAYLVSYLIPFWQDRGYRIVVGTKLSFPPADIALMHVDLTKVPLFYRLMSRKYPVVLNGNFPDNSKIKVSQNLLDYKSKYGGPVIVKTNYNYGGIRDVSRRMRANKRKMLNEESDFASIDWRSICAISPEKYPVFKDKSEVPEDVWLNKRLVVEKFLPEYNDNGLYCMRACFFFGDQEVNMLVTSDQPVIKGSNLRSRELLNEPAPEALRTLREKLKIDFGRLDYVVSDGRVVLYDANKTATLSRQSGLEWADQIARPLSQGIEKYL